MSLTLRALSKSYVQGSVQLQILHDLSLTVARGEILAIVGESGSGKSTLLSLLAGFAAPDSGEITWDGHCTNLWSEKTWAQFRKTSIGFIFQNYHLIPYLDAQENVALPLRLLRAAQADARSAAFLQRLGLAERLHHLPNQLSGGERQRVAMARALIHQPKLVLADEPTGSLDSGTGTQVLDVLFGVLREVHQTALIVTHSHEVATRCDRILQLKQGRLCSV